MTSSDDPWSEAARAALRRLASETRERAIAARVASRELSAGRASLVAALSAGWREQSSILGELRESRDALEAAVRTYARALRRDEIPPEQMLVRVKELVRSTRPEHRPSSRELMEQVVRWSIEGYYEEASV